MPKNTNKKKKAVRSDNWKILSCFNIVKFKIHILQLILQLKPNQKLSDGTHSNLTSFSLSKNFEVFQ